MTILKVKQYGVLEITSKAKILEIKSKRSHETKFLKLT